MQPPIMMIFDNKEKERIKYQEADDKNFQICSC